MFSAKFVLIVQIDTSAEYEMKARAPLNLFKPQVIITGCPKAILSLRFIRCYVRCCSFFFNLLTVLNLTLLCLQFV